MEPLKLAKEDVFVHVAPGAAGHGDPLRREPALVLADLADGRITEDFAREVYGVVVDAGGLVARDETARERERLAAVPLADRIRTQTRLFLSADPLLAEFTGEIVR
jgi:N-methylhydantoinase B